MIKQKRILITGANGFIGSHLTDKALALGYQVYAGVRTNSDCKYLQHVDVKFVHLVYKDKETLASQLRDLGTFDYIIHNAGITKSLNKSDFEKINYINTVNLIEGLKKSKTIPNKFILISSLSVMGIGDEKNYIPFKLSDKPHPNTAYGKSKLKAEEYLRQQVDIPYLIIRPTGVYGPREKDYLMMIKSIKYGFGISAGLKPQYLTFIYIKDLASCIFKGIESNVSNRTYFISDGHSYTDKEYRRLIKEILRKRFVLSIKIPLAIIRMISIIAEWSSRLSGHPSTINSDKYIIMKQRNWRCNIQPLIKDFNFSPEYNLKKGLEESIEWYKKEKWL